MADYKRMYIVLCKAIDKEIDILKNIPLATASSERLEGALQEAEEIYIETSAYMVQNGDDKIIEFHAPK